VIVTDDRGVCLSGTLVVHAKMVLYIKLLFAPELSMGWVDPWVGLGRDFSVIGGLGWVNYSKSTKNLKGLR